MNGSREQTVNHRDVPSASVGSGMIKTDHRGQREKIEVLTLAKCRNLISELKLELDDDD